MTTDIKPKNKILEKTLETIERGNVTRPEIVTILSRINQGKHEVPTLDEAITLDSAHVQQGYEWLMNLYKSPTGKVRSSNPFGFREIDILENFSHIIIVDFYNGGNPYRDYFSPLYAVYDKDDNSFDYVVEGGKVKIVG